MAGRESVFSHPDVVRILSENFVSVTDNCSYTQTQDDAKGEFFRKFAEQGHYGGRTLPTPTRQGLYACTSDGELLASINTRDPDQFLEIIQQGMSRWRTMENSLADVPDHYTPDERFRYHDYPEGGLVLKLAVRDLPREDGSEDAQHNLDFVWFTADEVGSLFPSDVQKGASYPTADVLASRLARNHFIDAVRGQSGRWSEENVERMSLRLTVDELTDDTAGLRIEGEFRMEAPPTNDVNPFNQNVVDMSRGMDLRMVGRIRQDRESGSVTGFDAVAAGTRWGATTYNGRFDDLGPAPIGFAFEVASDKPIDRTPPAQIGRAYFAS